MFLVLRHGGIDYGAAKWPSIGVNNFVVQSICAGVPTVTACNIPRSGPGAKSHHLPTKAFVLDPKRVSYRESSGDAGIPRCDFAPRPSHWCRVLRTGVAQGVAGEIMYDIS